jgi:lauroyl/myristoyl acyltransferase
MTQEAAGARCTSPTRSSLASRLIWGALRAFSPTSRFNLLCTCSRALAVFLPVSSRYHKWHAGWRRSVRHLNQTPETALYRVLARAALYNVEFDPVVELQNTDQFFTSRQEQRGVLLVGVHTMLNKLALRWLHDTGVPFAAYSVAAFRIPGTQIEAETLNPSNAAMLRARTLLRTGAVVAAMIDRPQKDSARVIEIRAGNVTLKVSDALLKLALKCRSPIVFFATRVNESGRPLVRFGAPSAESNSASEIAQDLGNFVAELLATSQRPIDGRRIRRTYPRRAASAQG